MNRKPTTTEKTKTADESAKEIELQATSYAKWPVNKGAGGTVVTLPSGGVARLREPPLRYLLATGRVPPKLWSRLSKDGTAILNDPIKTLSTTEIRLFIDWMVAESFVEPVVSMTRKDDAIYINDLSDDDKGAVMNIFNLRLGG